MAAAVGEPLWDAAMRWKVAKKVSVVAYIVLIFESMRRVPPAQKMFPKVTKPLLTRGDVSHNPQLKDLTVYYCLKPCLLVPT